MGNYAAIIPTITGRAWITGQSTLMLDPEDPYPRGLQDFRHLATGRAMMKSMRTPVTCLMETRDKLGEGLLLGCRHAMPVVADLIAPSAIHRLHPASGAYRKWQFDEHVTAMAKRRDGTVIVASHRGLNIFEPGDRRAQGVARSRCGNTGEPRQ